MMTFVQGSLPDMAGVIWTVEGDGSAVAVARRMVRGMMGRAFTIDATQKPLYHAFGAFLSPLLVVHLQTAAQLALKTGIPSRDLALLMRPILMRTFANFLVHVGEKGGSGKAFSGPLIRGDVETIRVHLRSLRQVPSARRLYIALLRSALESDLPLRNRSAVRRLLSGSR
jgi:predicted short-subunit dehydrogenase-like oxidoreductase (DUF2520 family)